MIFVRYRSNPRGGLKPSKPQGSLGPSRYFGLPMVNLGRPPLPPNRPYCWPFNYLEYVKDFDPNVMLEFLRLLLKQMVKQKMQKLIIFLVLPS